MNYAFNVAPLRTPIGARRLNRRVVCQFIFHSKSVFVSRLPIRRILIVFPVSLRNRDNFVRWPPEGRVETAFAGNSARI
jgi:hypothetical protein